MVRICHAPWVQRRVSAVGQDRLLPREVSSTWANSAFNQRALYFELGTPGTPRSPHVALHAVVVVNLRKKYNVQSNAFEMPFSNAD